MTTTRPSGRSAEQIRNVSLETSVSKHAEGSCLVKFGDTHVLCTASLEARVPPWLRGRAARAAHGLPKRRCTKHECHQI